MNMREVFDFLKKAGVFFIATEEGDQPRVRPFGAVDLFEGRIYLQTGRDKAFSRQIAVNPKVELCACMDGRWLRVNGKLVEDDRREAKKHMLDSYPQLRRKYSEDDGNTLVLYYKDAEATFSSFTEAPRTVRF